MLLIKLKEALVAENSNYIAAMVIVTGNVVSDQPGQLDADEHITTVQEVYTMIQEVFSEAFIFPVLGSQDTFPQRFFPFTDRNSVTNWSPELSKREQYIDRNVYVT